MKTETPEFSTPDTPLKDETVASKPTELGDAIYDALKENVVLEKADWAVSRIDRVLNKIQPARNSSNRFRVVVPWLQEFTAFTAPGKYIFISRRLFEVCPDDEMIAFIIGHEIAHHDLGHIRVFPDWFRMGTSLELLTRWTNRAHYGRDMNEITRWPKTT